MKLKALEEIDILQDIKPIVKVIIPSEIELIYLSTNLLYQSHLLMRGESVRTGNLTARECTNEAIGLMKIINSYDTRYFTLEEMQQVRRDYKLNGIYNAG